MPFVLDVGRGLLSLRLSPLKHDMGKNPRPPTGKDPGESKAKQLKYDAGNEPVWNSQQSEAQPSAKEVAAALAARARLYGGATESSTGVGLKRTCTFPVIFSRTAKFSQNSLDVHRCTNFSVVPSVSSLPSPDVLWLAFAGF